MTKPNIRFDPVFNALNQFLYIQAYQFLHDILLDRPILSVHVDLSDLAFHPCHPVQDDLVVHVYQADLLFPITIMYYVSINY